MTKKTSTVSRRTFLSNAAIIGASGTLGAGSLFTACSDGRNNENKLTPLRPAGEVYIPELPDKAIDGKPVRAAIIGCGARGTGAAFNFLSAADNVSVVACAEVFKDKLDRCRKRLKEEKNNEIADDMCFLGFDAYKKVCELPGVDMVIIASPSLFHPEQFKYAIEQGKHVFCEKPAAIDAAGYRTYMMAVKQAQSKRLCVVTGTYRHYNRGYVESYKKIQEGYIGRILSASVYYNIGHISLVRPRPEWTNVEYMIRDMFNWKWLTGDHVVDQLVHCIDFFSWFSHMKPLQVIGMGSRLRRVTGDIYDNFGMDFEYPGGVHLYGMARQIDNCDNRVSDIIQGTKGTWSSWNEDGFTILDHDGNVVWKYDKEAAQKQFKQHDPYTLEHVDLINHIRSGKVINYAETLAISSMACIMARESAYSGRTITWDAMTQADMNFMPADLTLRNVDMSKFTIPVPGTSPEI